MKTIELYPDAADFLVESLQKYAASMELEIKQLRLKEMYDDADRLCFESGRFEWLLMQVKRQVEG